MLILLFNVGPIPYELCNITVDAHANGAMCSPTCMSNLVYYYASCPCDASINNTEYCVDCNAGAYMSSSVSCSACPEGTYSPSPNVETSCNNCPVYHTSFGGQTDCNLYQLVNNLDTVYYVLGAVIGIYLICWMSAGGASVAILLNMFFPTMDHVCVL